METLDDFLQNAPAMIAGSVGVCEFKLYGNEAIHCVLWEGRYFITGMDTVKVVYAKIIERGFMVSDYKRYEEGVYSDLRVYKIGYDAQLEEARSPFLEFLYANRCIKTKKKQKVFYWGGISFEKLAEDALARESIRGSSVYPVRNLSPQTTEQPYYTGQLQCDTLLLPEFELDTLFSKEEKSKINNYETAESLTYSAPNTSVSYNDDLFSFDFDCLSGEEAQAPSIETCSESDVLSQQSSYEEGSYNDSPVGRDRRYRCNAEHCGKRFKRYEHLKRHFRIHTGERPFMCPVPSCNKRFSRSDNLKQHMRIHSSYKEYENRVFIETGGKELAEQSSNFFERYAYR